MKRVTLLKGEGIGPEITESVLAIFQHLNLDIVFEEQLLGNAALKACGDVLPPATLDSIKSNRVALKAPYQTEVGQGYRSVNVALRQSLDLYANIRPITTLIPTLSPFGDINLTIVRENTEDLYIGKEEIIEEDKEVIAIKKITRLASERICRYAFDYAQTHNFQKVTAVHKANILKDSDGLFLRVYKEIKTSYPLLTANDLIVDNAAMQLVLNPQQFQVMVMPNLYGDILSDLASGLVGGLGLAPSANIGENYAVFEACHGSAPDIAGKNLANPTALLLSACMMLEHIGQLDESEKIKTALFNSLADKHYTTDLGGSLSTKEFTDKIIAHL